MKYTPEILESYKNSVALFNNESLLAHYTEISIKQANPNELPADLDEIQILWKIKKVLKDEVLSRMYIGHNNESLRERP